MMVKKWSPRMDIDRAKVVSLEVTLDKHLIKLREQPDDDYTRRDMMNYVKAYKELTGRWYLKK